VSDVWLTTGEAAEMMAVGRATIVNWCNSEKLPCTRTERGFRKIRYVDVLALNQGKPLQQDGEPE
jgi:excisionase family DNA binding protein